MNIANDRYDLERFVLAQAETWARACAELAAGRKESHWMWYVFPQLAGLGHSAMAQLFAIRDLDEARAYWLHPLLGPRLKACCEAVLAVDNKSADQIFGYPDNLKFHSSLTLFNRAVPDEPLFRLALEKYFAGDPDEKTLGLLRN